MKSPCISVCRINSDRLCEGCLRTMDEIRDWRIMTDQEKASVLEKIEERKDEHRT